jgi:hypothetical protein
MKQSAQHVAELTVYDRSIGATRLLTYAVKPFTTAPGETPANTLFDPVVSQPLDIERTMFAARATRGRATAAFGQLVLENPNGDLDALNEYVFDGRPITIRRTTVFDPSYPSDYTTVLSGTMTGQPEMTTSEIRVTVRDKLADIAAAPLQTTRYAGTNALPDGLEGVPEDLMGKPKPLLFGVAKSIPAPCVNTSKLIYQISDGAIDALDAVYDRGNALLVARTWASAGAATSGLNGGSAGFGDGLFVVVDGGGELFTSSDGVTWTSRATGLGAGICVAYGNGTWVAITDDFSVTSSDGTTWTTHTEPARAARPGRRDAQSPRCRHRSTPCPARQAP